MTVAPTFEKCRPIFELKVTPLGPLTFLFEGPNMTVAPTFEKCRPIFELKVTPYFQS